MKLKVVWMRWALVLLNLALLAGFCTQAFSFFKGDSDEITTPLSDPNRVVVPEGKGAADKSRADRLINALYLKAPKADVPVAKPIEPTVMSSGGPLDGWYIHTIASMFGKRYAFVCEQPPVDETVAASPAAAKDALTKAMGGARTPSRAGKTGPGTRRAGGGAPKGKQGLMMVGEDFWDLGVTIEEINFEPQQEVIYKDNATNKRYTLTRNFKRTDLSKGLVGDKAAVFDETARGRVPQPEQPDMVGRIEGGKGGAKTAEGEKAKDAAGATADANKESAEDLQKKIAEAKEKAREKQDNEASNNPNETPPADQPAPEPPPATENTEKPAAEGNQGTPEGGATGEEGTGGN